MKKANSVQIKKSALTGNVGKNSSKIGHTVISSPKLPNVPSSSGKSLSAPSYLTPKSNKSSSSFGIIWLPGRRRNKHKEIVYNSHKTDGSKERAPSMYNIMSGDSSNQQTLLKKKEEDIDLFVSGKSGNASVAVAGAGVVTSTEIPPDIVYANPEEKNESQEFIRHNKEDSKEAAGDTKDIGSVDKNGLESRKDENSLDPKTTIGPLEDNVDSVFLRSQPAHKVRSTASTVEEEDCGIKCLYYTLQCCDCVLM